MASTAATADSEGERQGSDEHRPLHEILRVIRDVQHREAVQNDPDEDRASHGADHVRAALVELICKETHSCYIGDREHSHEWGYGCGACPACDLRGRGYRRWREARGR